MNKIIVLFFLGAMFVSCNPEKQFASELKTIDEDKNELDSVKTAFSKIKMDSVLYIKKTALDAEKFIKANYNSDTINFEFANKLSTLKRMKKTLGNFERNTKLIAQEIAEIDTQYVHLKTDILNGVLNKEQIDTYLLEEKVALDNLKMLFDQVNKNQAIQLSNFYKAYPSIANYMETIKSSETH